MKLAVQNILNVFKAGNSRTQRLRSNALWSIVVKIVAMLLAFVKVPVVLSYLDNEHYGVWLTIVSIVHWTIQFDFGLGAGLRYRLTEAIAQENTEKGRVLVSTAYVSLSAMMLLVLIVLSPIIFALDWNSILNVSTISQQELRWTIFVTFLTFVAGFVLKLISTVILADQRTALSSVFQPLSEFVALFCVLLLGEFSHNSLFLASFAMTAPSVLTLFLFSIYYYNSSYKKFSPSIKFYNKDYIRSIFSMGLKYFVGSFASLVVFGSSSIIISHFINPTEVGVYNTARTFFGLIIIISATYREPLKPAMTDAYVKKDYAWIIKTIRRMNKVSLFFSFVALLTFICGDFAIELWTKGRIEVPLTLSLLFTAYSILNIYVAPYDNFIVGVGKLNIKMIVSVFKMIFFIPVAILLVKTTGPEGMIIATILINTLPNAVTNILQYRAIITNKTNSIWYR